MRTIRIVAAGVMLLGLGVAGPATAQSAMTGPGGGAGAMSFDPSVGLSGYAGAIPRGDQATGTLLGYQAGGTTLGYQPRGTSLGYQPTGNDLEGHGIAGGGLTYIVTNARN